MEHDIDFEKAFEVTFSEMEKYGEAYAKARALSWKLQEQRKVLLSQLALQCEGKTVAEREDKARSSDAYKLHLEGTEAAIYDENSLKAKYEAAYAKYEAYRSLCSLENSRMKLQ